jgi:cytochrome c oxidase subunit I+III
VGGPPGFLGWLGTLDHKRIGRRYVFTAFVMFALAGVNALVMRAQLARPNGGVVGPDLYNQLFTVHGTTMMFLFAVPVMQAMGIYFVPLMVGTRNVAFPRLNALGYWIYLIGCLLLWVAFFTNTGPNAGWFDYVPLAGPEHGAGKRVDVWAQTITFTEISALIAAIEVIVTAFKQRAPGMMLDRVPLYVWAMVVVSFMVIFAMPVVATASLMLQMDRSVATHFFNPAEGGDPLLWQHLFWFFGHPEVYIIFLPATGLVSTMLPSLVRRPVVAYPAMVAALVATGFLSFALWVHHMFVAGVGHVGGAFFTAASLAISIPTGLQIFSWIFTIATGRPRYTTPFLFILGFLFTFVIGGMTGVMIASAHLDSQLHDSFFIVAHLHYVLIGGSVFPLIGAIYFWFPKMTGRLMSDRMGKINFFLLFAGANLTFFPMHILGLRGMPRRIYTYLPETGWGDLNLLATIGAFTVAVGVLLFVGNVVLSLWRGERADDDPWEADTLEWTTASPPPAYNWAELPCVEDRAAAWARTAETPVVVGLATEKREVLVTTVMTAEPDLRHEHPRAGIIPLVTAVACGGTFIGAIFTPWAALIGGILLLATLIPWAWPPPDKPPVMVEAEESDAGAVEVGR